MFDENSFSTNSFDTNSWYFNIVSAAINAAHWMINKRRRRL